MTEFLAFTQGASEWLLGRSRELDAFIPTLLKAIDVSALKKTVFSAGPIRMAASQDGNVLALWHAEYLTTTGTNGWGYIKLAAKHGALVHSDRFETVIRTSLRVFEARLQGLLLPDSLLPRSHGNESFTCTLGSGHEGRNASIGYLETSFDSGRGIVVVGPEVADGTGGNLIKAHDRLLKTLRDLVRPQLGSLIQTAPRILEQSRSRPAVDDAHLAAMRRALMQQTEPTPVVVTQPQLRGTFAPTNLTYNEWIEGGSPLSSDKRRILEDDYLETQPLRISGPAGSGKTLLLRLMAVRAFLGRTPRPTILYLAHNVESQHRTRESLKYLSPECAEQIEVATLNQLCVSRLSIPAEVVLDGDATETRSYQMAMIAESLQQELASADTSRLPLLGLAKEKGDLFEALVFLIMHEISSVLKPYRLYEDPRRYSDSEKPYSRFHGLLSPAERRVILKVFADYHNDVFEVGGLLDADDLALSLLSRLRTPLWTLQRKTDGYDFVFVDETQLYNENERRLFPLLTKATGHLPIAFALDEAQGLGSNMVAGLGALGIQSLRDEALQGVFRTTADILRLAFHVIQRTTDLFGPDFPDFTKLCASVVQDERVYPLPSIHTGEPQEELAAAVVRHVREIRRKFDIKQIGVIIPSDRYYSSIIGALRASEFQFAEIAQRGQSLDMTKPIVAASTPRLAGGQEFDAVIVVGVERGVVPPFIRVEGLALALEQKLLRELYLSFTRAKYVVRVVNSHGSRPSDILSSAISAKLLEVAD